MTARQAVIRRLYAELSGRPEYEFEVVDPVPHNIWLDWYDVVTGKGGQCFLNADGSWKQAPRGACPVVMRYQGHSNE